MKTSFQKSFGKVAAITYLTGVVLHLVRILSSDFTATNIPFWFDGWVVLGAGYGGAGFVIFRRVVQFGSRLAVISYALIAFHLLGSVVLHAYTIVVGHHDAFKVFPIWYSYIIMPVMGGFAWYSWCLRFKDEKAPS